MGKGRVSWVRDGGGLDAATSPAKKSPLPRPPLSSFSTSSRPFGPPGTVATLPHRIDSSPENPSTTAPWTSVLLSLAFCSFALLCSLLFTLLSPSQHARDWKSPRFAHSPHLSATLGRVCDALVPKKHRDPLKDGSIWNHEVDNWNSSLTNTFNQVHGRWTDDEIRDVLAALQGLVPLIENEQIQAVGQLIQGWQLRNYPRIPLRPLLTDVAIPPSQHVAHHPHQDPPSTPSLHGLPSTSPPSFHHPGSQSHSMLQRAADLFNTGFAPQPQIAHQSPQQWQNPNFARPTEDDLSYFVEIFPLFSPIRVAWERFVQFRCPEGERDSLFNIFNEWEREVKEYVPQVWAIWGMGRTQSKELLDLLLKHLRDGTFHVLPPIEIFEMLPCVPDTFAVLASQLATPAVPHPPSSAQGSHNSARSNLVLFYQQYKHECQQLLRNNPHLLFGDSHQQHQQSPYRLPPHPDPNERSMQELSRWHRRMTDRQARRYGTSSRAFEAGL